MTNVTTVVSLTLLHLAFVLANALAKRDISRAIAHPLYSALKEVVVTSVTTVVSLTLLRARQGERLAFVVLSKVVEHIILTKYEHFLCTNPSNLASNLAHRPLSVHL